MGFTRRSSKLSTPTVPSAQARSSSANASARRVLSRTAARIAPAAVLMVEGSPSKLTELRSSGRATLVASSASVSSVSPAFQPAFSSDARSPGVQRVIRAAWMSSTMRLAAPASEISSSPEGSSPAEKPCSASISWQKEWMVEMVA